MFRERILDTGGINSNANGSIRPLTAWRLTKYFGTAPAVKRNRSCWTHTQLTRAVASDIRVFSDNTDGSGRATELTAMIIRLKTRYRRTMAELFFRRRISLKSQIPLISFTFDDFPRSSLRVGGAILESFGFRGSFYASMGRMGKDTAVGEIFLPDDLTLLISRGHELGCHSFGHLDPWTTNPARFEQSLLENAAAVHKLLPGYKFRTFSYPFCQPHPRIKNRVSQHFLCCRSGGERANTSFADLNLLSACFLERYRETPDSVRRLIDENCKARGWLIFATHDISDAPSRFGCDMNFFEGIIKYSAGSGAAILPVIQAYEALKSTSSIDRKSVV